MVARHAERGPGLNHAHHQPQHGRDLGAAVYQIAEKDGLSSFRWANLVLSARWVPGGGSNLIAELFQQRQKLIEAAVHVADDVERSVLALPVGPERLPLDD